VSVDAKLKLTREELFEQAHKDTMARRHER
jgi:hypothetical protein